MDGIKSTSLADEALVDEIASIVRQNADLGVAFLKVLKSNEDVLLRMGRDACPTADIDEYIQEPRRRWKLFAELSRLMTQSRYPKPGSFIAALFFVAPVAYLEKLVEQAQSPQQIEEIHGDLLVSEDALRTCEWSLNGLLVYKTFLNSRKTMV